MLKYNADAEISEQAKLTLTFSSPHMLGKMQGTSKAKVEVILVALINVAMK